MKTKLIEKIKKIVKVNLKGYLISSVIASLLSLLSLEVIFPKPAEQLTLNLILLVILIVFGFIFIAMILLGLFFWEKESNKE